ncbi:MAG: hypothetical protein AAF911_02265 [Planctomycetota bacterium]
MKNKDFGFFQQHVEKIALGVGGLVLVGVGATQFLLGDPNAIEVKNQPVAPSEIADAVIRESDRLKSKLADPNQLEGINAVIPRYADSFAKLYNKPVGTDQMLAPIDNTGLAMDLNKVISPDYPEKFLPTPPMATDVLAKSAHGVLANDGSDQYFAVLEMVGDRQPADFNYVSVSGTFSFEELISRYSAIDIPGEQRIDAGLWRERLAITSVQLLREELDPTTGEWGNRVIVNPLPGSTAIVPSNQPTLTFEESQDLEQQLRSNQRDLRQPLFPSISNGPWTPPDIGNRVYTPEELQRREDLERLITRLQRQLDRLQGTDDRSARGSDRRSERSSRRGGPEDFEDYGDLGGSDRESRRGSRRGGGDEEDNPRADREARQIAQLEEDLMEAERELNELLGIDEDEEQPGRAGQRRGGFDGPDFDDFPDDIGPGITPGRRGNLGGSPRGEESDVVKVWAHDLTVEPGKTYRYKVLVSVMNPLYRFPRLNPTQLAENRNRVSLGPSEADIAAAEWSLSGQVTVEPEFYYFVDSANKEQKRADIEVWTVYDGMWRKNEFVEYPGNEVGGIAEPEGVDTRGRGIAMNVGTIMLDVDSISRAGGSAVRVLLLDPETNRITTRLVNEDKNSDARKRLELEADLQAKQAENRLSEARP